MHRLHMGYVKLVETIMIFITHDVKNIYQFWMGELSFYICIPKVKNIVSRG